MKKNGAQISTLPIPTKRIDFKGVSWNKIVYFDNFIFFGETDFQQCKFFKDASFKKCKFFKNALFDQTKFHKGTFFSGVNFLEASSFLRVSFNIDINATKDLRVKNYETRFIETTFSKKASFFNAEFSGSVNFFGALFLGEINRFMNVTFKKSPFFYGTIFKNICNFADTTFYAVPNFTACEFRNGLDITNIKIEFNESIKGIKKIDINDNFKEMKAINYKAAKYTWQVFREIAKNSDDSQNEIKYLKKEFDVAHKDPSENNVSKFLIFVYSILSGYGTSITKPFILLVIQFFIFSFIYICTSPLLGTSVVKNNICIVNQMKNNNINAILFSCDPICSAYTLSFIDTIIFIPIINKKYYEQLTKATFGKNHLNHGYFKFRYIQKSIAMILFFLIGLGIRNRLRLR
jgi:hypothetical protein